MIHYNLYKGHHLNNAFHLALGQPLGNENPNDNRHHLSLTKQNRRRVTHQSQWNEHRDEKSVRHLTHHNNLKTSTLADSFPSNANHHHSSSSMTSKISLIIKMSIKLFLLNHYARITTITIPVIPLSGKLYIHRHNHRLTIHRNTNNHTDRRLP